MPTGRVKWFNNAKGYGFILPDEGDEDLFVHYSSILMDGYKTLEAGQLVTYEILKGPKGSHAIDIHALDEVGDSEQADTGDSSASESEESGEQDKPEFVAESNNH